MKTTIGALLFLLLTACATPERRIQANPEVFNALTVEQQEMVRRGEVGLGFAPEAVQLAKGRPNRVYTRRSAEGESMVWSYVRQEVQNSSQWVDVPVRGRRSDSVLVNIENTREVEILRIEFREGLVVSVETLE